MCLVPATDFIDLDAYLSDRQGTDPISFKDSVINAREVLATGPGDNPEGAFLYISMETQKGKLGFFSVDRPGILEVVACDTDIIDALAEHASDMSDAEAARRFKEANDDPSFMVPLPEEMVQGLELSQGPGGITIVPRCHIGFVLDYERLKD